MDIKIKTIDTVIEAGKDFLQKVITPPLEEVGLLLADKIKFWRLQNQLKIIIKAETFLKENNVKTKRASLKLLTPLLEDCSLEESESLQEKWASLLANIVREDSKIDSTIFSYILSQLTPNEAVIFDQIIHLVIDKINRENGGAITTFKYNKIDRRFLKGDNGNIFIELDNLVRLRLIKEIESGIEDAGLMYQVTILGLNFYSSCQFKKPDSAD